jgi:hypothetical protein
MRAMGGCMVVRRKLELGTYDAKLLSELKTNSEDPPTPEVQKFFDMLRASEESLHEHMIVSVISFMTRLTIIKSKFAFSNKCYKELLSLISDVLPSNHKMSKDIYQSKKLLSTLGMEYEKIDVCEDNCMLFYKEHCNTLIFIKI